MRLGYNVYTKSLEIVCREWMPDDDWWAVDKECDNIWNQDFETDDSGNVEETVHCDKCGKDFTVNG